MKTISFIKNLAAILTLAVSISCKSNAQEAPFPPYLTASSVPSSKVLLPPPPEPGSVEFLLDEYYYFEAKKLRDTPRGQQAIDDAKMGEAVLQQLGVPLGHKITEQRMPALYKLLMRAKETFGSYGCNQAKEYYARTRPFVYYGESSLTPWDENWLKTNYSYPSGHSAIFYGLACILSSLKPERQEEIYSRADEGAYSRVIAGCHWMSDTRAARVVAMMVFARLQADSDYQEDFLLAKKELARIETPDVIYVVD